MAGADARKMSIGTGEADNRHAARVGNRHVDRVGLGPFADQRQFAGGQRLDGVAPGFGVDDDARPRPVADNPLAAVNKGGARGHPSNLAMCSNHTTRIGGM